VLVKDIPQHAFDHIADPSLGICHTYIQGHLWNIIYRFAGIITHEDVSHLGSVTMGYYKLVTLTDQENQILQGICGVLLLLINGSQLIISQQRISTQGDNCKFTHVLFVCDLQI